VQLVIAAITIYPSFKSNSIAPYFILALFVFVIILTLPPSLENLSLSSNLKNSFILFKGILSCGLFGPAILGSTLLKSSSIISV
jgi:hypothetical protein